MILKKIFVNFAISVISLFAISACGTAKNSLASQSSPAQYPTPPQVYVNLEDEGTHNKFVNLDYGIRLNVRDERIGDALMRKFDANPMFRSGSPMTPGEMNQFVSESMRRYMRNLGFTINADIETDYMMSVVVKEFNVGYFSGSGWQGTVTLGVEVYDRHHKLVYPNVNATGSAYLNDSPTLQSAPSQTISRAYANALKDIDWNRIAFFLKKSSSPKQDANKQVNGNGDSALENTVIRWYIVSKPQGADVSWRIVSSTPEVKNNNSNFLGSTPYESTETFDIKGLTYNNAGNVQIEVTCEKDGYIPQRKRFNLLQAIDQKEISTKFNLVKEDE